MNDAGKVATLLLTLAATVLFLLIAGAYRTTFPRVVGPDGRIAIKRIESAADIDEACLRELVRRVVTGEELGDLTSHYAYDRSKREALDVLIKYLRQREDPTVLEEACSWFKRHANEYLWAFYEAFIFSLPPEARPQALIPASEILRRGFHEDVLRASPRFFERLERTYTRVDPRLGLALCHYLQITCPQMLGEATLRKIELAHELGVSDTHFDLFRLQYQTDMSTEARARYESIVAKLRNESQ